MAWSFLPGAASAALVRERPPLRSRTALLAILFGASLTLPGPAAASGVERTSAAMVASAETGVRQLTLGGRSARAEHHSMAKTARSQKRAWIKESDRTPPDGGAAASPTGPRPPAIPRIVTGATAATIATTTTLQATPNPLTYPQQLHVVATVTPAPQPSGGFIPAVGFYVDGALRSPVPLDGSGVGSDDLSLAPGVYSVTAVFAGLGDYEASTSAPVIVTVEQRPLLATENGIAALQAGAGFQGDAQTSAVQAANPSLGVGPTDIVQMTETGARFYDRDGQPLFHLSLSDFFVIEPSGQDSTPRGPRILYDTLHGRWIATQVTHDAFFGNGHVYVEISDTSDATGGSWVYRFDFVDEAPRTPAIGVTSDKVTIGFDVDVLSTGVFKGSTVMVLNIADLMTHPSTINYSRTTPNPTQGLWRPAIGLSAGNTLHAVGSGSASVPAHVLHLTATGTVTGPGSGVNFNVSDLTSGPAGLPDVGTGVTVPGPTSALWSNDHLWFVSTRTCLPPGDPFAQHCVRVTELSTSPADAILQDFAIARSGYASFGGGIGLAGDGSLVVVYSQRATIGGSVGAFDPISTYATIQVPGDPVNTVRPRQLIDQGTAWCFGGPSCVGGGGGSGSYLAVPADPTDSHSVWEGAVTSVSGGWRTWVTRIRTVTGAPTGTMTLADGRPATNSLRLGIGLDPEATSAVTQVLVSNSPTTSEGRLAAAIQAPIGWRMPWSLADATTGGSSATGSRTVYLQWGDGRGNWSEVQSKTITIDTPLGSGLVPLNPARLLDTRTGNGLSGPFLSRVPRTFQVTGRGGVPAAAVAVTGNLTVTGQTSGGFVFLGPSASSSPASSTLNFPIGDNRANGVIVKLSGTGRLGAVFVGSTSGKTANLVFDVTGYLLADDPSAPIGSTWVPIQPTRVLDTRTPVGLSGRFYHRVPRTFCITGCAAVPDDAVAVTGNLTVTGQTTGGYVFLGPNQTATPTSSTLNFPKSDNRANNVTVRLDVNGNLTAVFVGAAASASTNLIFDVTGYFVQGPWGATFIPLDPSRILDTRSSLGLSGPFVHRTPRSFPTAGNGGVPATGTLGVAGNLTLTKQSSGGYAFLGPSATASPTSSTINVPLGDNRANGVDVGLATNGFLSAVWVGASSTSSTHMIFDVSGYFR